MSVSGGANRETGKYSRILFCTDIDGTLTAEEKISPRNAEAIRKFQAGGGFFTVATGRFPDYPRRFAPDFIPNAPVICVNGTVIYDLAADRVLQEWPLDFAAVLPLIRCAADRHTEGWHLQCCGIYESRNFSLREAAALPPDYSLPPVAGALHKIMIIGEKEDEVQALHHALLPRFGAVLCCGRSWSHGLEVNSPAAGKDVAARWLQRWLNARLLVAAGDYDNDAAMLRAADISYAVANAAPTAAAAASRRAPANTADAIAHIIEELAD